MTFEIVKSFPAIKATVHGFAGGGTKLADQFCVVGIAPGTGNNFLAEHFLRTKLLFRIGWSDAKGF